jgi:type IX secretion system PorP/SprF family membrane protein
MKTSIFIILSVLYLSSAVAQDIHFSQMEAAPLNLNPALAGANSPMQAIVSYRSQWKSVANPFTTVGASFDMRFNENQFQKKGIIAGGLSFYNDASGDNRISNTNAALNLTYHLMLDRAHMIGMGIYGGYGQRSLDAGSGKWASQYDGSSYNASLPSGEIFGNSSFSYLDAGAGLLYTYSAGEGYMTQNNDTRINAGIAFYHVNNPNYSFIDPANEKLYMRYSLFANGIIGISNSHGAVVPGVYFNQQKNATEILYGTYYRYTVSEGSRMTGRNKPAHLSVGLFHRWGDAVIPKFMMEWYTMTLGFAYDINISKLTTASNARGGMEFFLRYTMETGGVSKSKIR